MVIKTATNMRERMGETNKKLKANATDFQNRQDLLDSNKRVNYCTAISSRSFEFESIQVRFSTV